MDLLEGHSLRRRLRRDYRIDVADSLWIMRQSAEALAAMHRAGFLHGDVKPDNIHLVNDGTAVLIDLGFAHRPGENARLREQGYILGTVNYLAPELCAPGASENWASDLFSFGVTFFELVSGKLPYPPGSVTESLRRHACDPPTNIRQFALALPMPLVALIEKLLDRRPGHRPRAAAVVQQLIGLEISTLARRRSA
jgi:serine/threonine protein kinase